MREGGKKGLGFGKGGGCDEMCWGVYDECSGDFVNGYGYNLVGGEGGVLRGVGRMFNGFSIVDRRVDDGGRGKGERIGGLRENDCEGEKVMWGLEG